MPAMKIGKNIDTAISEVLELFKSEFYLKIAPFVMLLNPKTQCFHYYGREFYKNIVKNISNKSKLKKILTETIKLVKSDNDIKKWYCDEASDKKTKSILLNNVSLDSKNKDYFIDIFLDLLLNTPISRCYGVTGQTFHTRIPKYFYNEEQFNNYSGAKSNSGNDIILDERPLFISIINTLEEAFWKDLKVKSAIMSSIPLYGQIAGIAFVASIEKEFTPYDYIRFLQLVKELGITLIKDAKEYEFLSAVLEHLPVNAYNVTKSVFKSLPILYNITGACLKQNGECSCLVFEETLNDPKLLPLFQMKSCSCNNYKNSNLMDLTIISSQTICNIHTGNKYLKPKSGLQIPIPTEEGFVILYFDFEEEVLGMYKKGITLALGDVFKLIGIAKERGNVEKQSKMLLQITAHDINRHLLTKDTLENKYKKYLKSKLNYFNNITGEIESTDVCKSNTLKLFKYFKDLKLPIMGVNWKNIKINSTKTYFYTIEIAFFTIFENLISNSFRYSGKEEKTKVQIKVKEKYKCIEIEYENNGSGFSNSVIKKIKRWKMGDLSEEEFKENKGTGIYSIEKAVKILGGSIKWPPSGKSGIIIKLPRETENFKKLYSESHEQHEVVRGIF